MVHAMQSFTERSAADDDHSDTSNRSKSNSSVIYHFVQNFELSGFGSPGEALVQTVKELVDNAIDACRWRSAEQDAPTIRVVLRRLPALQRNNEGDESNDGNNAKYTQDPLELQVADNGAGLTDITKALILFSSTKSGHGLTKGSSTGANAGKYGLGLTLSLLYSQKSFGGFLKLTTATLDSTEWSFTKCNIDLETGQPCTVYRKTGAKPDSWTQGCGTDMRLLVPGCENALEYAEPRLKALFARMHLSPDRAAGVTLACEGCLDGMSISVPRGGRECSPRLLIDNQDLVRAFAMGLTAMIKVNDGAPYTSAHEIPTSVSQGSQASSTNDGVSERCAGVHSGSDGSLVVAGVHVNENASLRGFPDEDVAVFECQGKHGTRVTASVALERPVSRRIYDDGATNQRPCSDVTVPLLVHRFVNGVPMLDTNTSSACALVAGVSKAGWRGLGLKISASRVLHSEGRLRFVLTEAPTPLKVKGGAAWSALQDIKAVHVSVAANAETMPYTSLRKDAIAHKEGYVPATASAVKEGLLSLSRREIGGFRSAAEAAKDMMQEDLIPLMASSIASMVERSGKVSFQKDCLEALGVGAEYVQQERLSDLLRCELRENIREEEERRAAARGRAAARKAEEAEEAEGAEGAEGAGDQNGK